MTTKIIAVANHKGGVGKTTTVSSLGSILAQKGYRVLLIDLDAQSNLTTSLVGEVEGGTIYDVLTGKSETFPTREVSKGLYLVPASLRLAMADIELSSVIAREQILSEAMKKNKVQENYDFVLLDCPPSLGLITLNAFTSCTDIVIPLICEVLPFVGLTMISDFTSMVQNRLNPHCHITGILITRWESSKLSRKIEEKLRVVLKGQVFQTKIRKNIRLAEAPLEKQNIMVYDEKSNGAKDYASFAEEFITVLNKE